MNAISMRSRVARGGRKPTETLTRIYDKDGRVIQEWVRRNGQWFERPSTLPVELENRPLADFVGSGQANLITGRVDTATWVDGNAYGSFERLTTDSSGAAQFLEHDGASTYGTSSGEVYYNSPTGIANPASSTAGVVYFCSYSIHCDDSNIEELELAGSDWETVVSNASSSLRAGVAAIPIAASPSCAFGRFSRTSTLGGRARRVSTPFVLASFKAMRQQEDPCLDLKYAAGVGIGTFVVNGVAAVACTSVLAWLCGGAAPALASNINATGYAMVATYSAFAVCRYNHPIGSW